MWSTIKNSECKLRNDLLFNSFSIEVIPVLRIYRVFGRFPYEFSQFGVRPFSPWSIPAIYSFCYYALTAFFTFPLIGNLIDEYLIKANNFDKVLLGIQLSILLCFHLVGPPSYWWMARDYITFLRLWGVLERNFQKECYRSLSAKLLKCYEVSVLPIASVLIFGNLYIFLNLPLYFSAACIPIFITFLNDFVLWYFTLTKIKSQIKVLNSDLLVCMRMGSDLEKYRIIWLYLSRLTVDFGSLFTYVFILTYVTNFMCFVISSYGFTYNIFINPNGPVFQIQHFLTAVTILLVQFSISHISHKATQAVGSEFCCKMLSIDFTHLDNRSMNQLQCFLRTIVANPPIISLAGFAVLDKTLIVSFYSNMITYLVVLLQFSASFFSYDEKKNIGIENSTYNLNLGNMRIFNDSQSLYV